VGWIGQYMNPGLWSHGLPASTDGIDTGAFWVAALQIVLINILLSGDNAVVIALVCRGLPPRQRFWGVIIGAAVAAFLLLVFTALVSQLMGLACVKLIGGVLLFYIAAKLLVPERTDGKQIEAVTQLWRAVRTVAVADIVMGLDNMVAVAAVAHGNLALLLVGLSVSIPIVLAGAALVIALLDRLPILVWVGAALLGWIAGELIATDPIVSRYSTVEFGAALAPHIETVAAGTGAALVLALGALRRRLRRSKSNAQSLRTETHDH